MTGWIGVDFDGTLAIYDSWCGHDSLGEPVPLMLQRVKEWLNHGHEVRIVTARAAFPEAVAAVEKWCIKHIGIKLVVTDKKDFAMIELWDDRCVRVELNTGIALSKPRNYHS